MMRGVIFAVLCTVLLVSNIMVFSTSVSSDLPETLYNEPSFDVGTFSSGNGTKGNPYGISTLLDLQNMSSNLTAHYVLKNDIDASNTRNWNNGSGFEPIGNDTQITTGFQGFPFNGTLNGDGYEIKNLYVNRSSYSGLFGAIGEGEVLNLTLTDVLVIGGMYTGGITGYAGIFNSECLIKNCSVSGEVRGYSRVGGIAGYLADEIRECSFTGNVSGGVYLGGIAGIGHGIVISDCYCKGNITGTSSIGGILGRSIVGQGYLYDCYSQVNIIGSYQLGGIVGTSWYISIKRCGAYDVYISGMVFSASNVGGLCGMFYEGRIEDSFSTGLIKGGWRTGGLAGVVSDTSIFDSYSTVDVYGDILWVGGFIGRDESWDNEYCKRCYSAGYVNGAYQYNPGGFIGGGSSHGGSLSFSDCYFDNVTSGQEYAGINKCKPTGVYPRDTDDMTSEFTFSNFDLDNKWNISDGSTYPYLRIEKNHPVKIVTKDQTIASKGLRYCFKYKCEDMDGSDVRPEWSLSTNASWLSIEMYTGILDGMVPSGASGNYFVNVSVKDEKGSSDFSNFSLSLVSGNNAPRISGSLDPLGYENAPYRSELSATKDTGEQLRWSVETKALWLELDEMTGTVTGLPGELDIWKYKVEITVTDGRGASDWYNTVIRIKEFPIETGSGTVSDPYVITNLTDLSYVRLAPMANFSLKNDIGAYSTRSWDGGLGFAPIAPDEEPYTTGFQGIPFTGSFDGNGHTIRDLYIDRPGQDHVGLFGHCSPDGVIKELEIEDCYVRGRDNVGSLCGSSLGLAQRINSSGRVISTRDRAGGLIGGSHGNLNDSWVYMDIVSAVTEAGGISGYNTGSIENCSSKGYVIAERKSGGIVGFNGLSGHIFRSNTNATVKGSQSTGGVIGDNSGSVERCYCWGEVNSSSKDAGGFIGYMIQGSIEDSYSVSEIHGNVRIGGFAGAINMGSITNCYAGGTINGNSSMGGFTNINSGGAVITASYYDSESLGNINSQGGIPKTTLEMTNESMFVGSGWNFSSVWSISEGRTYPYLGWEPNEGTYLLGDDNTSAVEDIGYSNTYFRYDPDPIDVIPMFMVSSDAGWLGFDNMNMTIFGHPCNDDVGSHWTKLSLDDGRGSYVEKYVTIDVDNVNDAPIIEMDTLGPAVEDIRFSYSFSGSDIDPTGDILTWIIITDAPWLTVENSKGMISGTPSNDDVGSYYVNATMLDDKGGSSYYNSTLMVENVNDPPSIRSGGMLMAVEDEPFWTILDVIDVDPLEDILIWSIISTNAPFVELDEHTGNLSFTSSNDEVGNYWILVNVSDGNGGEDRINLTLSIENVNDPPMILMEDRILLEENAVIVVDLVGLDIDPTIDDLIWSINTTAGFVTLNIENGTLLFYPGNDNVGIWMVIINLTDLRGGYDEMILMVTVTGVNDAPMINRTIEIGPGKEDGVLVMDLNLLFYDIDSDDLDVDVSHGPNITVTIEDGVMSIVPLSNWSGTSYIVLNVSDGELHAEHRWDLEFTSEPDAPYIESIDIKSVYGYGEGQNVTVAFGDPDLEFFDHLLIKWSSNTTGPIGEGEKMDLSLPPGYHMITVNVSDSFGLFVTSEFEVFVEDDEAGSIDDDDISSSGDPNFIIIIVVLIVITIIIIGIVLLLVMKKKGKEVGPEDIQTGPGGMDMNVGDPSVPSAPDEDVNIPPGPLVEPPEPGEESGNEVTDEGAVVQDSTDQTPPTPEDEAAFEIV